MTPLAFGYIYVHTSADGLPLWSIFPLTCLGCAIAFWLLRGIAFVVSMPSEQRLRRRVAAVHAAGGPNGPYSATVVQVAAEALFKNWYAAWDAGDRTRMQQLSDPDLMADWMKRMDAYQAKGKRQRVKIVRGPKLQYVSLLADRQRVRLRIRARVRRRFEPVLGPRKEPRFGLSFSFEEFWTLQRRGEDWILWSTRSTKFRQEYTTEPIVPPGQQAPAPATVAPA
jgi:hypothetical protein